MGSSRQLCLRCPHVCLPALEAVISPWQHEWERKHIYWIIPVYPYLISFFYLTVKIDFVLLIVQNKLSVLLKLCDCIINTSTGMK